MRDYRVFGHNSGVPKGNPKVNYLTRICPRDVQNKEHFGGVKAHFGGVEAEN
jgi:hypothetical protein